MSSTILPVLLELCSKQQKDKDTLSNAKKIHIGSKQCIPYVPEKTRVDTNWCKNQWNTWCRWKLQLDETLSIMSLSCKELAKSMEIFVLEARKKDSTEYVPNTQYTMVCGIMRHLRASGDISINFFKND